MWTAVILFVTLAQGQPMLGKSKTPYQTEEACNESLAKVLTELRSQTDLATGKCIQGDGQPS